MARADCVRIRRLLAASRAVVEIHRNGTFTVSIT